MNEKDQTTRRPDRAGQVSLATLAAHLNLSQAAISRVLNQAPAARAIPKSTQDRIFAAALELKYRPNVLARSLRRGHSMTIGVLLPELSEGYTTLVLAGLEHGLSTAGYAFMLCSHHHQQAAIDHAQTMLLERAVDGIVAIDTRLVHPGPLPSVTVSCPDPGHSATDIVLDHERGAQQAMEHLHALGHRKIALIKGQSFSSDTEPRWQATRLWAKRLGLQLGPGAVVSLEGDSPTHEPGYLATRRLIDGRAHFTALFCFNDVSAIGAIKALREAGLRVPEDVSVVGFDDVRSAAFQNPALTTVRQPLQTMGLLAAEEILRVIAGETPAKRAGGRIVVEPELVVRASSGPVNPARAESGQAVSRARRAPRPVAP